MKKLLISLAAAGILAGCSADDSEVGQEGPPETEVKTEEDPVTTDYLQERFYEEWIMMLTLLRSKHG